jgi:hypothetical protein
MRDLERCRGTLLLKILTDKQQVLATWIKVEPVEIDTAPFEALVRCQILRCHVGFGTFQIHKRLQLVQTPMWGRFAIAHGHTKHRRLHNKAFLLHCRFHAVQ